MFRAKAGFLVLFLASILHLEYAKAARILGFFPAPVKSHLIIHSSITDALAERGHNITIITTIPLVKPNPHYHHIQLDGCSIPKDYFNQKINNAEPFYQQFTSLTKIINNCSNIAMQHPKMKKIMAEEKFDLVILGYFLNDFHLGIGGYFKCPTIVSFMVQPVRMINEFVGNPIEVAYVPNLFGAKQPMNFWERLTNFLLSEVLETLMFAVFLNGQQRALYEQNFPFENFPSYEEARKNVSLVLVNHHFSQGPIRPNVPGIVEIGGIQVKEKPDPLPQDIKSVMDNAKKGIIYFSFGSNIQGDILDKSKSKIMFDILSKLPYTILWKWGNSDFPGQALNVIYKTWLPQDDVLAHPNVKLFVTHGGQGSVVESLYHGVPMVGVPLFAEQHANILNVEKKGYGRLVEYATITEESFSSAVNDVLTNAKYRNNIAAFNELYKDRPMSAKETAVFWVEYVLRHHGAPHMQSPAVHLNTFQLLSLDVIGFLLVVIYIVFKLIKICIMLMCSVCMPRKKNKKD